MNHCHFEIHVNLDKIGFETPPPPPTHTDKYLNENYLLSTGAKIFSKNPDGKPYTDSLTISRWQKSSPHDVTSDYKFPEGQCMYSVSL